MHRSGIARGAANRGSPTENSEFTYFLVFSAGDTHDGRFFALLLLGSGLMKSMPCRQLGGTCDKKLSAGSWDEMVKVMTKHVLEAHPDVAKTMEKTHKEDPKKWGKEMKPKWDATPDT
jgi:hypothetical protein